MIERLEVEPGAGADTLGPAALLASIKTSRSIEHAEAARQLDLAARWADLHPPESIHSAAAFRRLHRRGLRARGAHRRPGYAVGGGVLRG